MIIKKFQGKTEAEAVESAKKELGDGIVIMNVRNVKKKGMFSFLKPQMVEVTVALEEEPVRPGTVPEKDLNLTDAVFHVVDQRVLLAEGILQLADFAVSDDSALIQRILIAAAGLRRNPKALYALTLGQIFPQRNIADLGGGLL